MRGRTFLHAGLLAGLFALAAGTAGAQERPAGEQLEELVGRMNQASGEAVWDLALQVERLGPDGAHAAARAVERARGETKVALAKAILGMEGADAQRGTAVQALRDVIRGDGARALRVKAAELLTAYGRRSDVRPLGRDVERIRDPLVKIAVLKALRIKGRDRGAERTLREFLRSDDFAVRAEAALAIAEIGNVPVVEDVLAELQDEPTERGRRARAFLEQEDLLAQLEKYGGLESESEILEQRNRRIQDLEAQVEELRQKVRSGLPPEELASGADASSVPGGDLFKELLDLIQEGYVDEDKADLQQLIDSAAAGMVDSLDPFSSYMNRETLEEFNSSIHQQYGGIGAVVAIDRKTGYLTIQRPIYGNPAHEAGLRTLDKITHVEGQSTKGKTVSQLVKILKGTPGTTVTVTVEPFLGDRTPRDVELTRQQVLLRSVRHDMLPGQIGYVQLSQFGSFASREVEEALTALEGQGMRGLILDLRQNPGGLLSAAVEIADKFLDDDELVVYAEGRPGTRYGVRQEDGGPGVAHKRRLQPKHPDYPVVVLINENSASASEIVAGALQSHDRALLVGSQTFGKGSVQNIFQLESEDKKAALRMTVAYYYLPDGRLIHRPRDVESWRFSERMRWEIERWKQDGLLNDAVAAELLDQYEPAPGGVEPDYRVENSDIPMEKQRAYGQIYDLQLLETYIREHWAEHEDRFHALARSDAFDDAVYPDFDALWTRVQEKLDADAREAVDRNDVRMLLRATVRRFAQDDLGRELTSDFQEDRQLQAGIMVLSEQAGVDLSEVDEFSFIPERFPEGLTRVEHDAPEQPEDGDSERDFKK